MGGKMSTAERIIVEESDDDTDGMKENRETVEQRAPAARAQLLHHCISETQSQGLHPLGPQLASFQRLQPAPVMPATRVISPPNDFTRHQPSVVAVTSSSSTSTTGSPRRGESDPSEARFDHWLWMPNAENDAGRLSLLRNGERAAAKQVLRYVFLRRLLGVCL